MYLYYYIRVLESRLESTGRRHRCVLPYLKAVARRSPPRRCLLFFLPFGCVRVSLVCVIDIIRVRVRVYTFVVPCMCIYRCVLFKAKTPEWSFNPALSCASVYFSFSSSLCIVCSLSSLSFIFLFFGVVICYFTAETASLSLSAVSRVVSRAHHDVARYNNAKKHNF